MHHVRGEPFNAKRSFDDIQRDSNYCNRRIADLADLLARNQQSDIAQLPLVLLACSPHQK